MFKLLRTLCILTILVIAGSHTSILAQDSGYKTAPSINIGGEGRWDYCFVDAMNHRLYVSHGTKVHAIDLTTNTVVGEITGLNGVHGIAVAPELNKGFISNGRSDTVTVFDLKTLKVTNNVHVTGKNPDAIIYDPFSQRVFTFNGRSSNATAIDAKTDTVVGTLPLDGKPEFGASNLSGKMYVNIEDKSIIEEFDSKALKVTTKYSLAPCEGPSGLAIDLKNKLLFSVGDNKTMAVVSIKEGKVVASVPIGQGVDACAYDQGTNMVFSSNGEGTVTVIKQTAPGDYKVLETIPTLKGLRTMALDPVTHNVYLIGNLEGKDGAKNFGVFVLEKK